MEFKLEFELEKETKGTVRFKEKAPREKEVVGSLYVKKSALGDSRPKSLAVTIKSQP